MRDNPTVSISSLQRPVYHFTTHHWMNDPIPFWYAGKFHIFYQHNPNAAEWGDMHWGHTTSPDLAHWETLPIALPPTPGGPDQDGVFTGCVTRDNDGRIVALYTGIPQLHPLTQVHCLARTDDLTTWTKWEGNPIVAPKPEGYGECFRDPQVFETGDGSRYLVIGGELSDQRGGVAFLYRALSDDLTRWEYLHPLFEGRKEETGHDFECPDFFPLSDDRWLLITSRGKNFWHAGRLTPEMRFVRDAWGTCDNGNFYAAKTLVDGAGRRLLFGWITEARSREEQLADGWSGALSLPRVVTLGEDGLPRFTPAPELEALRGSQTIIETPIGATPDTLCAFPNVAEIDLRLGPTTGETTVTFLMGEDEIPLVYRFAPSVETRLRGFFDRSVIEIFPGDASPATHRVYPQKPGGVRLIASTEGEPASARVDIWELG